MVILKEISLKNFRSFKDEHTVEFLGPITAILGSNGSGKSNLADAIGFVMGMKSDSLRVNSMDQLIFRDIRTEQMKDMFVKAVLLNNDQSEVSFQRSVTGSACTYRIDNNLVSYADYLESLKDFHIRPAVKNFIVFQDFIESSVTESPKDRAAMFEEISGSALLAFEYKRLNTEIMELQNEFSGDSKILRELRAEMKALRNSKKNRAEYMKLEKQLAVAEINLMLFDLYRLERSIKNCTADLEQKTKESEENEETKSELEQALKSSKERFQSEKCEIESIGEKVSVIESKAVNMTLGFNKLQTVVDYARSRFASCREAYNSALKADEDRKKKIAELEEALREIEREKENYRHRNIEKFGAMAENTESQIEEYGRLKKLFFQTFAQDNERLIKLEREYELLHDKFDIATIAKDEAKDAYDRQITFRHATYERANKCVNECYKKKEELENETRRRRGLDVKLQKLKKLEFDTAEFIKEIDALVIDENSARKNMKKGAIIEHMRNHIPGVYGQLKNLCKPIDKSYELAMFRVFGSHFEYCVVDTMKTATACVEFLKTKFVGVVSFLALDDLKVPPLDVEARDIEDPPNVKLLYDVTQFAPPEIAKAVLYVTRNCLVCETSNLAARIASNPNKRNRYTCVSRDGIYCRKNGIFTGGQMSEAADDVPEASLDLAELYERKEGSLSSLRSIREEMPSREQLFDADLTVKARTASIKWLDGDVSKAKSEFEVEDNKMREREDKFDNAQTEWEKWQEALEPALKAKEELKSQLQAEESQIFADFCVKMGVANIQQYENGEEMYEKTFHDLDNEADRIKEQLAFETLRDTGSKVLSTRRKMDIEAQKFEAAVDEKDKSIVRLEYEKIKMETEDLMSIYGRLQKSMEYLKSEIASLKALLHDISKKLLSSKKQIYALKNLIPRFKQKRHVILIEARIKGLKIPTSNNPGTVLTQNGESDSENLPSQNGETGIDRLTPVEDSSDTYEIEDKIEFNYSKLPRSLLEVESSEANEVRKELEDNVAKISSEMEEIGDPAMRVLQQLNSTTMKKKEIERQMKVTRSKLRDIVSQFDQVKEGRQARFMKVFEHVSNEVDAVYKKITGSESAQAYLIPDNPEEPYLGGVHYQCVPPGKLFRGIEDLSGGEKALASMALICSNRSSDSAPFQILDEVDAALDDTNVEKIVKYITNAQDVRKMIIITHKPQVYNATHSLVRVLKKPNTDIAESKIITLNLHHYRLNYQSSRA